MSLNLDWSLPRRRKEFGEVLGFCPLRTSPGKCLLFLRQIEYGGRTEWDGGKPGIVISGCGRMILSFPFVSCDFL